MSEKALAVSLGGAAGTDDLRGDQADGHQQVLQGIGPGAGCWHSLACSAAGQ